MAVFPSWVVLRSRVPVFLDSKKGQGWETIGRADKVPVAGDGDGPMASMILGAFTLDAHLVHPPEISTLALRAQWDVPERSFFCAVHRVHENLIVIMIYSMRRDTNNYLLVHDAPTNSLSLVPHVLNTKDSTINSLRFFCLPPIALRIDDGYSLANLAFERNFTWSGRRRVLPSSGTLFWWSSTSPGRWTPMEARFNEHGTLPPEQLRGGYFKADVTFIFQGKAFWVDLLLGVVVCDLLANKSVAELKFVGLPPGCEWPNNIDVLDYKLSRGQPEDHRTMGVVGDKIRFVSLSVANCEGYPKHPSPRKIMVKTWTLVVVESQLQWERNHDMTLALTQLWKCKTFRREMLPRCAIMRPVLNPKDGIVYFLLGDYYSRRDCIGTLSRGEFLICVDMRSKTLVSRSYLPLNTGLHRPHRKPLGSPDDREFYPEMPCIYGGSMFDITGAKNQLKKKRRNTAISDGNCEAKELMKKKKDNYEAKELMNITNVRV